MDSIRSKSAQYRILRNGQKKSSKYFSPIPCTQERTKVDTLHQLLFPFCNDATKILKFLYLSLKWIINVTLNLDWRECKIFLGSNFLLVARLLFVLSCIRPKKRHPKEPVVPEEKDLDFSQIYSGPYLPKVFIDSRLSGRLTPAVSGRKRPF